MQVASSGFVAADVVGLTAEREDAPGDAVGVPADGSPLIGALGVHIILQPVVAQDNVFPGKFHRPQDGAVGKDGHLEAAGRREAILLHGRSVRQNAERAFFNRQHDLPFAAGPCRHIAFIIPHGGAQGAAPSLVRNGFDRFGVEKCSLRRPKACTARLWRTP